MFYSSCVSYLLTWDLFIHPLYHFSHVFLSFPFHSFFLLCHGGKAPKRPSLSSQPGAQMTLLPRPKKRCLPWRSATTSEFPAFLSFCPRGHPLSLPLPGNAWAPPDAAPECEAAHRSLKGRLSLPQLLYWGAQHSHPFPPSPETVPAGQRFWQPHSHPVPTDAHQPLFPRAPRRSPQRTSNTSCPSLPREGLLCPPPPSLLLLC